MRFFRVCRGRFTKADSCDPWIDRLVYELYRLTEEEIRIVEEGTAR